MLARVLRLANEMNVSQRKISLVETASWKLQMDGVAKEKRKAGDDDMVGPGSESAFCRATAAWTWRSNVVEK